MKFSASILAATLAIVAPLGASAFSTAGYTRSIVTPGVISGTTVSITKSNTHSPACACGCTKSHHANCACFSCSGGFTLRMSDTATEGVPSEVEALDGVASGEEAHNVERPARGSGIQKHKDDRKKRTPLDELEVGSTVEATVKTIAAYGAFLDIGAKSDALLHVSRLSDNYVANVEDVVKQGDKVSVRIISVDTEKNQVAVTMRTEEAEARAAEGGARPSKRRERPQRSGADQSAQAATLASLAEKGFDDTKFVEGEVVSSLAFGAFVRFDAGQVTEGVEGEVDGLVHISALSEGRVGSVDDVVSIGDKVQVRVREVDAAAGRISLSMITKEQEETSRPAPRERKERGGGGGGREVDPVGRSWKDTGASDWQETMKAMEQPAFTNTAVVDNRRK